MTQEASAKKMFYVILIVVIASTAGILVVFGPQLFQPPTTPVEGDKVYPFAWDLPADTSNYIEWELGQNLGIYGNFSVDGGDDVVYYLFDEENYDLFIDSGSGTPLQEKYTDSDDFRFKTTKYDFWYWVFFNNGTEEIHVEAFIAQDATAPEIEINLTADGEYADDVVITATITDTFDIEMTELYIDDILIVTQSGPSFVYAWNTTLWDNGEHTIQFTAADNVGNSRSITIPVVVDN